MFSTWLKRPTTAQEPVPRAESPVASDPATTVMLEAPATLVAGLAAGAASAFDIATRAARADGSFDAATVVADGLSDLDYSEAIVTPGFSAPERYAAGGDVGAWSDVYSCAATLGAAMAGVVPPDAAAIDAAPGAVEAFLEAARQRLPDNPQWLAGIQRGLRANVSERAVDIGELRTALGLANSTATSIERSAVASDGASVFVSYAHKDSETVETFVRALQRRGAGVWIDRKGIKPGSRAWGAEILKGMRGAQVVLLFASSNAMASDSVKEEIYLAKDLRKPILVARLDEVPFADDVHLFLTRTQHIAATTLSPIEFAATVVAALDMRNVSDLT